MKTSNILLAVSALLTHVMALPADSDADVLNTFLPPRDLSPTSGDGAQLDRRCTWNDGHGVVPCDTFAIIWGDNTWSGGTSRITIAGSNFKSVFTANCDNGNAWEGFSTMLPFVVSVQMGNACKFGLRIPGEIYDGTVCSHSRPR